MADRKAIGLLESASRRIDDKVWQSEYKELITAPVNPEASPEARALLNRLYELRGKGILTGQHEYLENPNSYCEQIKTKTGVYPAIKGVEFGGINGQTPEQLAAQRQRVVDACIAWHAQGGIITATYHPVYPGRPNWWEHVKFYSTQAEFDAVVTPGTPEYTDLLHDIDQLADYLKQLRDADIPVLWRPYHEMNGDWFWYGHKEKFAVLWEIMFNRYVNVHGLNNLLWVWSPNANNEWSDDARKYYPGHDRADVLGMDIYNADYKHDYYMDLLDGGQEKVIAITENGEMPNPMKLRTRQPMYSYNLTWGSYLTGKNADSTIRRLHLDPYAINLGQDAADSEVLAAIADETTGDGLAGRYYVGKDFGVLKDSKVVKTIHFSWAQSTPVGRWDMSVVWSGFLRTLESGEHALYVTASGGVRLYVDSKTVIDDQDGSAGERTVKLYLEAGYHSIKLEYCNTASPAYVQLAWAAPGQWREIIPQSQLYST